MKEFRAYNSPEAGSATALSGMVNQIWLHIQMKANGVLTLMILATWNVNSINTRLTHLIDWISFVKPNVLCLQETKVVDEKFPRSDLEALGYSIEIYGEKSYNGVAILSDKPLSNVVRGLHEEVGPGSKRIIAGSYGEIRIIDVYIPNGGEVGSDKYTYKLEWLASLKNYMATERSSHENLVLCGDFNIAPDDRDVFDPNEVKGTIMCSDAERSALEAIRQTGLEDAFRRVHQKDGLFSWWDYRMNAFRRNIGFRIDHIWTSPQMADKVKTIYIDREPRKLEQPSDHAPVVAEFA